MAFDVPQGTQMAALRPGNGKVTDMEMQGIDGMMHPVPPVDNSLACGLLRGKVPITGEFKDGDGAREVDGSMYWSAKAPNAADDGKLDVAVFLHARDRGIGTASGKMRLGCDQVRRLLENDPGAEAELLCDAVKMVRERGYGEYDLQCDR